MNNKNPQISIITITYNAAESLHKTLKNVFEQDFLDYEHIIIDGKSTDNSLQIINNFVRPNLKYISEKDYGIADAFNKGLKLAKGKYICFLNAGDVFSSSNTLSTISPNLDSEIVTFALDKSASKFFKTYPDVTKDIDIRKRALINHQVTFVKKEIFECLGGFNICYKIRMDYDFFFRVLPHSDLKFCNIPIIKYDAGTSGTVKNQYRYECEGIIIEYLNLNKNPFYLLKLLYMPMFRYTKVLILTTLKKLLLNFK